MDSQATPRRRTVVGVDGSRASRHAVLWAAQETRKRHEELVIIHLDPPVGDAIGIGSDFLRAKRVLEANASAASQREPEIVVATLPLSDVVSDELIMLSRSATMLVIGVDLTSPLSLRGVLGPVDDRVVVQATCPVVILGGIPVPSGARGGDLVVGWTDDPSGRQALRVAAEEAVARGASLTLVTLASGDQDPGKARYDEDQMAAALREAYPHLSVEVVRQGLDAVETLIERSRRAELLLLSRPYAEDHWRIHTGPLVARLVREARSPSMLVGGVGAHDATGA